MTSHRDKKVFTGAAIIFFVICTPVFSLAGTGGHLGPCVDCHTMHNSQDNQTVTIGGGLNDMLLVADCITCHTGQNLGNTAPRKAGPGARAAQTDPPFVDDDVNSVIYLETGIEPGANTLAGGSFYWIKQGRDSAGHNVKGITGSDSERFSTIPGSFPARPYFHLECAGTYGCHGDRGTGNFQEIPLVAMKGSHHGNDNTVWKDGTTLAKSYRFLNGTQGFGSPDYEYSTTLTLNNHNKYFGKVRTVNTDAAAPDFAANSDNGTMSGFCASCHTDYHNGVNSIGDFGSGAWIRHPTDYDLSNPVFNNEYLDYNRSVSGIGPNPYNFVVPLATESKSTEPQDVVLNAEGDAVVICLSCHRAHGSPWAASLRWNYRGWPAAGYDGCSVCHTTKD